MLHLKSMSVRIYGKFILKKCIVSVRIYGKFILKKCIV